MSPPESSIERQLEPAAGGWRLEMSYRRLPALFYSDVAPTPVRAPRLVMLNESLAQELGLDPGALAEDTGAGILAGNALPPGAEPLAQAYAGHQYGNFVVLGDGRAVVLGEQLTPSGRRYDLQLKGAGPTPYSRRGDGRAAMGPMLREYIISEAMQALGIPTTRSLAVAATGEEVWRQEGALPGAVLTRVATSHIRVGTFEWAAARDGTEAVRALVDYTCGRHYPELSDSPQRPLALLRAVAERQAALIAQWMLVGFVHGVMNTDNMAISGETIDYGPCAFIDAYDPATVFSSIDRYGRYAYGNQPAIAQWNLARFGETLLPLIDEAEEKAIAEARTVLEAFPARYHRHWMAGMRRKLGLVREDETDNTLVADLLEWMRVSKADYINTLAALDPAPLPVGADARFEEWHQRWLARLKAEGVPPEETAEFRAKNNPAVIPRNHLVEEALAAAVAGDLQPLKELLVVLGRPFAHGQHAKRYREPAREANCYRTFCGT
jgi:serine/tyrosine/threonine adenylyltransferase